MQAEKAKYSTLPKSFLYVRVGLEGDEATVKQIPRYRLDVETVDRIFQTKTSFLQESKSGAIVMPDAWKDECLPAPALYIVREKVQPKLEPDALELELYRGSVGVFATNVPDDVDEDGMMVWLGLGLDDDDPEQVSVKLRLEELQSRLKEVDQQMADIPLSAIAGTTVEEETRIKDERMRKLRVQRQEIEAQISLFETRIKSLTESRSGRGDSRGFRVRAVETVMPLRTNVWEIKFDDTDRGRRLAYVATHKLNWHEYLLAYSRKGTGRPEAHKAPWTDMHPKLRQVSMRGVSVVRLQHGRGMIKFGDERGFYSGQWRQGLRHGLGVEVNAQGRFSGRLVREWRRGEGTQVFANGDVYRGTFGSPGFHEKMSLISGDEYADGIPDGEGHIRFVDGAEYYGRFRQGRPWGEGTYTDASGSMLRGSFGRLGLLDGKGSSAIGDLCSSGTWKDGLLHGRGIVLDRTTGKHVGMFAYGLKHGYCATEALQKDCKYFGYHKYGLRDGIGRLDSGHVDRDRQRKLARERMLKEAAAGQSGAGKAKALEEARKRAAMEIEGDDTDAAAKDGSITGSAEAAIRAAQAGLGAADDIAAKAMARAILDAKPDERARTEKSEYDKFRVAGGVIPYPGDKTGEGRFRADALRVLGSITLRKGRPEAHAHTRVPSANVKQSILPAVTDLHLHEERSRAARARAQKATISDTLSKRLHQEAENLKSFAYWQQLAQKRLGAYKRKTLASKAGLQRIKRQLARPDDEVLPVGTAAAAASARSSEREDDVERPGTGLGSIELSEEQTRLYASDVDGSVDSFGEEDAARDVFRSDE